jgi:hypothetical protein
MGWGAVAHNGLRADSGAICGLATGGVLAYHPPGVV